MSFSRTLSYAIAFFFVSVNEAETFRGGCEPYKWYRKPSAKCQDSLPCTPAQTWKTCRADVWNCISPAAPLIMIRLFFKTCLKEEVGQLQEEGSAQAIAKFRPILRCEVKTVWLSVHFLTFGHTWSHRSPIAQFEICNVVKSFSLWTTTTGCCALFVGAVYGVLMECFYDVFSVILPHPLRPHTKK